MSREEQRKKAGPSFWAELRHQERVRQAARAYYADPSKTTAWPGKPRFGERGDVRSEEANLV